jgi:hypothetical protein
LLGSIRWSFRVQFAFSLTGEGSTVAEPSGSRKEKTGRLGETGASAVEVTTRIGEKFKDYIGLHGQVHCGLFGGMIV